MDNSMNMEVCLEWGCESWVMLHILLLSQDMRWGDPMISTLVGQLLRGVSDLRIVTRPFFTLV